MKLVQDERAIDRVSIQTERTFSIKATGKAFRILSSGLYKDKVLAIVRELSCNAYDSHVAAGCPDKPFDVHLPNSLEPFFSVRDYGVGLSREDMYAVYTTYFESTKTESNDMIGAFGLGSKSPFSYVDSFTIISRFDGKKTTYTAFIAEDDMPSLVQMAEEDDTEGNGVEVIIPTTGNSAWEFQDRAKQVYRHFTVRPNIVGAKVVFPDAAVLMQGDGWKLLTSEGRYEDRAYAMMGQVAYPISSEQVREHSLQALCRMPLYITSPIGDLEVTASREELSYTKLTVANINKRLDEVRKDFQPAVEKAFAACASLREAHALYESLFRAFPSLNVFGHRGVPYKGTMINSGEFSLNLTDDYPGTTLTLFNTSGWGKSLAAHKTFSGGFKDVSVKVQSDNKLRIFVDDLSGKGMISRVRYFREYNRGLSAMVVKCSAATELAKLKTALDGYEFGKLSELELAPAEARTPTMVRRLGEYGRKNMCLGRDYFETVAVDPSEGGIYVRTISGVITQPDGEKSESFATIYREARAMKLIDEDQELYSIPKTLAHKFSDTNWVDFHDAMRAAFTAAIEPSWGESVAKSMSLECFKSLHSSAAHEEHTLTLTAMKLADDHPLRLFFKMMNDYAKSAAYSSHRILSSLLEVKIAPTAVTDLSETWAILNERYPLLLQVVRNRYYGRDDDAVANFLAKYVQDYDKLAKYTAEATD